MQRLYGIIFCLVLSVLSVSSAHAQREVVYTGKEYIDIGISMGRDVTIAFPEPVSVSLEQNSAVAIDYLDAANKIVIIRPRRMHQQVVTFLGQSTDTIYLARLSDQGVYSPSIRVAGRSPGPSQAVSTTTQQVAPPSTSTLGDTRLTVTSMLKMMMLGQQPNSASRSSINRVILDESPLRVVATEVWETAQIVGVFVTYENVSSAPLLIQPDTLQVLIPSYGRLRAVAADNWELDPVRRSTSGYLIFTR